MCINNGAEALKVRGFLGPFGWLGAPLGWLGVPLGWLGAPLGWLGAPLGWLGAPLGWLGAPLGWLGAPLGWLGTIGMAWGTIDEALAAPRDPQGTPKIHHKWPRAKNGKQKIAFLFFVHFWQLCIGSEGYQTNWYHDISCFFSHLGAF